VYGAAHPEGRTLAAIRRELGYFRPNEHGLWVGSPELGISLSPDFGPNKASPRTGVVVVGATPWVMNYNVPIVSTDLTIGNRIARKVSQRGGGLPEVQAMALLHGDGCMEIACNLLNVDITGPKVVQDTVADLANAQGIEVKRGYLTGHSQEEILELALRRLLSTISSRDTLASNPFAVKQMLK
jgi:glutamate formiminotransferase